MSENPHTRSRESSALAWAIGISLLVHGVLLPLCVFASPAMFAESEESIVLHSQHLSTEDVLYASCESEVAMATLARATLSLTPYCKNRNECLATNLEEMKKGWRICNQMKKPLEVAFLDAAALAQIVPTPLSDHISPDEQKAFVHKKELAEKKKVEQARQRDAMRRPQRRIVEIAKPVVEIVPGKARHVSEYDSKVAKETVARGSTEKMVARPGPKELPSEELPIEATAPKADPTKKIAKKSRQSPAEKKVESVATHTRHLRTDTAKERGIAGGSTDSFSSDAIKARTGDRGVDDGGPENAKDKADKKEDGDDDGGGMPNLRPSEKMLARVVGGGSVDKLDGVARGDETALNTKRWKYATFFNRVKRSVAQEWSPGHVFGQHDPYGNVYGTRERITMVSALLDRRGRLIDIHIVRTCGVGFLDDEAVRAFRVAGPFPHPPRALLSSKKLIRFDFSFHFVLHKDRRIWRVFRG